MKDWNLLKKNDDHPKIVSNLFTQCWNLICADDGRKWSGTIVQSCWRYYKTQRHFPHFADKSFQVLRAIPEKNMIFVLHPKKKFTVQFAALYYGVSICLVTFASAMAVVTLNIHHMGLRGKDVSTMSLCLKVCFQGKDVSAINQSRCYFCHVQLSSSIRAITVFV